MKKIKDYFFQASKERSIILMALLAIIESLQLLIIVMVVFSFIPIPKTDLAKDLFPISQAGLSPHRKVFFFHWWIASGLLIHTIGLCFLKGRLGETKTDSLLGRLIKVDGCWLLLQLFLVFKMVLYPQAVWVKPIFYVVLGLSFLSRVFWMEFNAFLMKADAFLPRWFLKARIRVGVDVLILLFLFFALWIFDQQRLWSVIDLAGNRALADQGWGSLSPLVKGINYPEALSSLIILSLIYYASFYFLLRKLFGSILLAGCGVILAVKWQYFHNGITPNIWQFPSKSILPLLPDVFFWWFLLLHARTKKLWSLIAAGSLLGIFLAYHIQTGIWLWVAWAAYLIMLGSSVGWYIGPWVIGFGFWLIFCGFQGAFDLMDHFCASLIQVLQGVGSLPYYDCLKGRNFFAFSFQFIIPIIYLVTLAAVYAGADKKNEIKQLIIPISLYGLGLYTLHVWQPSLSNYDSVCSPLVIVLCFWAVQVLGLLTLTRRIIISSLFLIIYAGALLTNNVFGIYPNIWNVSGVNWTKLEAVHQQQMGGK